MADTKRRPVQTARALLETFPSRSAKALHGMAVIGAVASAHGTGVRARTPRMWRPAGAQTAITTPQMGTRSTGVAAATYAAPLHLALGATAQAAATQMADVDVLAYPRRDAPRSAATATTIVHSLPPEDIAAS